MSQSFSFQVPCDICGGPGACDVNTLSAGWANTTRKTMAHKDPQVWR